MGGGKLRVGIPGKMVFLDSNFRQCSDPGSLGYSGPPNTVKIFRLEGNFAPKF